MSAICSVQRSIKQMLVNKTHKRTYLDKQRKLVRHQDHLRRTRLTFLNMQAGRPSFRLGWLLAAWAIFANFAESGRLESLRELRPASGLRLPRASARSLRRRELFPVPPSLSRASLGLERLPLARGLPIVTQWRWHCSFCPWPRGVGLKRSFSRAT